MQPIELKVKTRELKNVYFSECSCLFSHDNPSSDDNLSILYPIWCDSVLFKYSWNQSTDCLHDTVSVAYIKDLVRSICLQQYIYLCMFESEQQIRLWNLKHGFDFQFASILYFLRKRIMETFHHEFRHNLISPFLRGQREHSSGGLNMRSMKFAAFTKETTKHPLA